MRYFFHLHHREDRPDEEGTEFSSDVEAWKEGTKACGQMMADLDGRIATGPEYRMECVDEAGRKVFTIRFSADTHLT